jgi:hypothetical protein
MQKIAGYFVFCFLNLAENLEKTFHHHIAVWPDA